MKPAVSDIESLVDELLEEGAQRFAPLRKMSLMERIENAIDYGYECTVEYRDLDGVHTYREFVPFVLGYTYAGNLAIRGYHTFGESTSNHIPYWRLFLVSGILSLTPNRKSPRMNRPPALYNNSGDRGMTSIVKQRHF